MAIRGFISHLDLNVSRPRASIEFYDLLLGHLGLERFDIAEDRACWSLRYPDGADFGIEIRPPAIAPPRDRHERHSPGIDHLAFHADSRADVDDLCTKLIDAGRAVTDPPAEHDYSPATSRSPSTTRRASGSRWCTTLPRTRTADPRFRVPHQAPSRLSQPGQRRGC